MLTEKELGERLKNVRKMRNISQFRMADMMGTEQSFIAKLEKGASYPKVSTLYRYAECVGFTLSDILAQSLGTSQFTVSAWVRGDRDTTVRLLLALEDLTGLTFREMFGECEVRRGRV